MLRSHCLLSCHVSFFCEFHFRFLSENCQSFHTVVVIRNVPIFRLRNSPYQPHWILLAANILNICIFSLFFSASSTFWLEMMNKKWELQTFWHTNRVIIFIRSSYKISGDRVRTYNHRTHMSVRLSLCPCVHWVCSTSANSHHNGVSVRLSGWLVFIFGCWTLYHNDGTFADKKNI